MRGVFRYTHLMRLKSVIADLLSGVLIIGAPTLFCRQAAAQTVVQVKGGGVPCAAAMKTDNHVPSSLQILKLDPPAFKSFEQNEVTLFKALQTLNAGVVQESAKNGDSALGLRDQFIQSFDGADIPKHSSGKEPQVVVEGIQLPHFHQLVALPPGLVAETSKASMKPSAGELDGQGDAEYRRSALKIRNAMRDHGIRPARIQISLYPLIGTDSTLAFLLFPNLITNIGIDNHPFWRQILKAGEKMPVIRGPSAMRDTVEIDAEEVVGPRQIAALAGIIPRFRLRRLLIFESAEMLGWSSELTAAIHGLLEFDQGPGTPIRRHLQLQLDVSDYSKARPTELLRTVLRSTPDVLLVQRAFHHYGNSPSLRASMLRLIRNRHGIILEGRERTDTQAWEFSRHKTLPGATKDIVVDDVTFGYWDQARLYKF